MDIAILTGYVLVAALLRNKWSFIALTAFCISALTSESKLYFVITALCYTPFCLHHDKKVIISSFLIVIAFYLMAWENAISSSYYLSNFVYVSFVVTLNFILIASLTKDKINDIYNTYFFRVYNNKFN